MKFFKNPIKTPEDKRKLTRGATTALVVSLVLLFNVIFCYLTENLGWYIYRARYTEDFTVSEAKSEDFVAAANAGRKVEIIFCMTEDALEEHSTGKQVLDTARQMAKKYEGFIKLRFVNVLTQIDDEDGKRVPLADYAKTTDGKDAKLNRTSVIFKTTKSTGEEVFRTLTNVMGGTGFVDFYTLDSSGNILSYNGETVIHAMLSWVLADEHKVAYFTTGHGESGDSLFTTLLASAGYTLKTLNLQDKGVPQDAELVVISGPKNDFEISEDSTVMTECKRLESYLEGGGKVYLALDPYVKKLNNLESIISEYGISLSESRVGENTLRNIVRDPDNAITADGYTLIAESADTDVSASVFERAEQYKNGGVIIREASALTLSGSARAVLVSSASSITEVGGEVTDEGGTYPIAAISQYRHDGADKDTTVFVVSSVYLSASDALISNSYLNREFLYSLCEEAFGAENLPYGCNSVTYVSDELTNLTMKTAKLYTALLLTVPVLVTALGVVIIVRRKNR